MNPYGDMFCHAFGRLFDVSSSSGCGEMASESAISAALRRRLFIVKIDVPQNHSTIKLRVKVVFYVTCLDATASINRYRLTNVAPTISR